MEGAGPCCEGCYSSRYRCTSLGRASGHMCSPRSKGSLVRSSHTLNPPITTGLKLYHHERDDLGHNILAKLSILIYAGQGSNEWEPEDVYANHQPASSPHL